jgi:hypothetical protein
MKQPTCSKAVTAASIPVAAPSLVSLRSMYADAVRDVMTDPRKALAEHDPGLAAWLIPASRGTIPKV